MILVNVILTSSEPLPVYIVDGQVADGARQESPWTLMFTDDVLICSESRKEVEEGLKRWAGKKEE